MRTVIQEHDNSCGVACVAMLAGVPYQAAALAIFGAKKPSYTSAGQIKKALNLFNIKMPPRMITLSRDARFKRRATLRRELSGIKTDALLKLRRRDHKGGAHHWAVWDARGQQIRDPIGIDQRLCKITSYLPISN
jgi:hypothetical protein